MVSFIGRARLGLVLIFVASPASAPRADCYPPKPEYIVYDLVDETKPDERIGSAFLVDAKRGLFLTARHQLFGSGLLLRNSLTTRTFRIVTSGNSTDALTEDWALLQTIAGDGKPDATGLELLPDAQLLYDTPSGVTVSDAKILGLRTEVQGIGSVAQTSLQEIGSECTDANVALVQASSYDHGNSGSPVFSTALCGVLGVTSRFTLPDDVQDDTRKRLLQLFWKYSDKAKLKDEAGISASDDITKQYDVIRVLLKNHAYVKFVPAKCIVDKLIDHAWKEVDATSDASLLMRQDLRPDAGPLITAMGNFGKLSPELVVNLADRMLATSWNWVDLLQVYDRYLRGLWLEKWQRKNTNIGMVDGALANLASARHYRSVKDSFQRWEPEEQVNGADAVDRTFAIMGGKGPAEIGEQFRYANAAWQFKKAGDEKKLDLPEDAFATASAAEMIDAGTDLLKILEKNSAASPRISPQTQSLVANTAAGFLAIGLAKAKDDTSSESLWGKGLSRLAQSMNIDSGSWLFANSALELQLANASKTYISDKASEEWKVATGVETRFVARSWFPLGTGKNAPIWYADVPPGSEWPLPYGNMAMGSPLEYKKLKPWGTWAYQDPNYRPYKGFSAPDYIMDGRRFQDMPPGRFDSGG